MWVAAPAENSSRNENRRATVFGLVMNVILMVLGAVVARELRWLPAADVHESRHFPEHEPVPV
jgi:hypothetical protein